ncbi:hypothetical protein J4E91_005858 [Alternaria rosae]|nr:hypothetical protein J4E91_005858 [Alternaria rosae]
MNQNNDFANGAASPSGGSGYALNHMVSYGGEDNIAQVQDQRASHILTRNGLRAEAASNTALAQRIIKDFCDSSERLEQIGAMVPTPSGLQYWVQDFMTGKAIIVAECVCLLRCAPGYILRVPRDVRLAFEALWTLELIKNAMFHSLSEYIRYIEAQHTSQVVQACRLIPRIPLRREVQIVVPQGPRTYGVRSSGSAGIHRYEWPESRKLAWLAITPRLRDLPEKALESSYCPFNSVALWEHVDVRLIGPNIQVTLVEIAAVGYLVPRINAQDELTKNAVLSSSSIMLESSLEALRGGRMESS